MDLFSGIGGITKALEDWIVPCAYCENDPHAQAVLLSRMAKGDLPSAPIWDDVRTLKGSMLPQVDIIYGGFPCQDISVAGKGKGLAGERSGLFFEVARLVSEIRPPFLFLENVPAINIRGLGTVTAEITKRGYDSRWITLSASEVGAPHQRKRWWLLANRISERRREKQIRIKGSSDKAEFRNDGETEFMDDTGHRRKREFEQVRRDAKEDGANGTSRRSSWWSTEPNVGRVANGIPFRVDRIRGLGNSVVPQCAKEAFKILMGIQS